MGLLDRDPRELRFRRRGRKALRSARLALEAGDVERALDCARHAMRCAAEAGDMRTAAAAGAVLDLA